MYTVKIINLVFGPNHGISSCGHSRFLNDALNKEYVGYSLLRVARRVRVCLLGVVSALPHSKISVCARMLAP